MMLSNICRSIISTNRTFIRGSATSYSVRRWKHDVVESKTKKLDELNNPDTSDTNDVAKSEAPEDKPIKFTESKAHLNYQATLNFYGDTRDLPDSHNYVLYVCFVGPILYAIWLREEDPDDNDREWFLRPITDKYPKTKIPLIQNAIRHNKRLGYDTKALEEELDKLINQSEMIGMKRQLREI